MRVNGDMLRADLKRYYGPVVILIASFISDICIRYEYSNLYHFTDVMFLCSESI